MFAIFVVSALLAVASAKPQFLAHPGYLAPAVSSQYHSQDELGQYSYGYAGGPSAKSESKTADGITRGAYSYIDANGITQHVQYVSDPVNGFRVAATNLPVGPSPVAALPASVAIPAIHHAGPVAYAHHPIAAVHHAVAASNTVLPGAHHIAHLPLPVQDTPEVAAAKINHAHAHADALARALASPE